VPGDHCLALFSLLERSPIRVINACDEQGAGFAADAYARLNGLGVVVLTYCGGGLKAANAIAQAYAERSPVILISGAPGARERQRNPLLHHRVGGFDTQLKVFKEPTVGATVLDDSSTAAAEIDYSGLDRRQAIREHGSENGAHPVGGSHPSVNDFGPAFYPQRAPYRRRLLSPFQHQPPADMGRTHRIVFPRVQHAFRGSWRGNPIVQ
jgi:hypothetical protein